MKETIARITSKLVLITAALLCILGTEINAQSSISLATLRGLATLSTLSQSEAGQAALGANFAVTGGLQTGSISQSNLLPFDEQQLQALRDVFITNGNLAQLSDGLGTTLGNAYIARSHYIDQTRFTSVSQAVADVIAYGEATTGSHSNFAKFFFANGTTDGRTPVSSEAMSILKSMGGVVDPFGRAYNLPAGTRGANVFGDSRPFQTEPKVTQIVGRDYFGAPANSTVYNRGPVMDLSNSPSYPSGHTTYGYTGSILLALLIPERYPQMVTRAAEYGNDRILIGAHYAMDVLAGRTLALYDVAHLLANDPAYVGQGPGNLPAIHDFRSALMKARAEVVNVLETSCGNAVAICAKEDTGRFSDAGIDEAFYNSTQTYGLPVVYSRNVGVQEDVGKLAPEAGYLLTVAFPDLPLDQANRILTETEGPGGGFLDNGSAFGVYSRLNLYAASLRALQETTHK